MDVIISLRAVGAHAAKKASLETRSGLADVTYLKAQVPLPETADELCAVARDVKAEARDIRLGAQATEREIKQLSASGELAKYRWCTLRPTAYLLGSLVGRTSRD